MVFVSNQVAENCKTLLSPSAWLSQGRTAVVKAATDASNIPLLSAIALISVLSAVASHLVDSNGLLRGLACRNKVLQLLVVVFAAGSLVLRVTFMIKGCCFVFSCSLLQFKRKSILWFKVPLSQMQKSYHECWLKDAANNICTEFRTLKNSCMRCSRLINITAMLVWQYKVSDVVVIYRQLHSN